MILQDNFKKNLAFSGKTALITGGANGIGKAICERFAEFNASIIIFDVDSKEAGETVEDIKNKYNVNAVFYETDLTDMNNIKSSVAECIENGRIDILVNNAGVGILEPAIKCSEKIWDLTFAVNARATFFLSQIIGKHMINNGYGKIVNMASQAGVICLPDHVAYAATKAAVISITKSLAYEWAQYGISVNSVSPTIVLTKLGKMNWKGPHGDTMKEKIPNKRFAMPEEIAYLVSFLASDAAAMINGENVMIDGGYTIQ